MQQPINMDINSELLNTTPDNMFYDIQARYIREMSNSILHLLSSPLKPIRIQFKIKGITYTFFVSHFDMLLWCDTF